VRKESASVDGVNATAGARKIGWGGAWMGSKRGEHGDNAREEYHGRGNGEGRRDAGRGVDHHALVGEEDVRRVEGRVGAVDVRRHVRAGCGRVRARDRDLLYERVIVAGRGIIWVRPVNQTTGPVDRALRGGIDTGGPETSAIVSG
jgi:hypothetical protein